MFCDVFLRKGAAFEASMSMEKMILHARKYHMGYMAVYSLFITHMVTSTASAAKIIIEISSELLYPESN